MAEHTNPDDRFPGLAVEAVCENGHEAVIADRGLPMRGACTKCEEEYDQRSAMWSKK